MSTTNVCLVVAAVIVVLAWLFIWSMCVVSKRSDEEIERMFSPVVPPDKSERGTCAQGEQ